MAHHRRLLAGYASVIALAGLLVGATQAVASPAFQHYVALGDSYASGPFIPNQSLNPIGCARSDHNYAHDLARSSGIPTLVDVSCGGAVSADMTGTQSVPLGSNPPQFNALTANTDLVTVTIGGNDIGFTSIIETCAEESITNPIGHPCQSHFSPGGTDELTARINADASTIAGVLHGIRARSPHAKVVLVGYLPILPAVRGCWPLVPVAIGDVPYLTRVEQNLNSMLGAQAKAAGDTFVNAGLLTGHDACQPESVRWVEGLVPMTTAFPFHPNAAGMTAVAAAIRSALG